jgi:hypothetical protein
VHVLKNIYLRLDIVGKLFLGQTIELPSELLSPPGRTGELAVAHSPLIGAKKFVKFVF